MKRVPVVLAISMVALLARHDLARAGSCSGGSSSSSGSSGSSGGSSGGSSTGGASSDSSDSSSGSSTPACVDDTDVVGYRKCSRYGQWADNMRLPAIAIEVGMAMRHVAPTLGERTGSITHESESFAYKIVEPRGTELAVDTALVFTGRAAMGLGRGFYLGIEGETGVLAEPRGQAQMMSSGDRGMPTIEATGRPGVFGALGVLGFRVRVGRASLSLEAAAGGRMTKYTYVSRYLACETTEEIYAIDEVVEGRARLEWWATPFVSVGASLGGSALDLGESRSGGPALVGGAYVGFHSRAFGGGL